MHTHVWSQPIFKITSTAKYIHENMKKFRFLTHFHFYWVEKCIIDVFKNRLWPNMRNWPLKPDQHEFYLHGAGLLQNNFSPGKISPIFHVIESSAAGEIVDELCGGLLTFIFMLYAFQQPQKSILRTKIDLERYHNLYQPFDGSKVTSLCKSPKCAYDTIWC